MKSRSDSFLGLNLGRLLQCQAGLPDSDVEAKPLTDPGVSEEKMIREGVRLGGWGTEENDHAGSAGLIKFDLDGTVKQT
ncbi:hypothetical protein NDU88_011350 [Pleurodeles waltl]|uniref:Uncharacterized protein n=1 Tax=Pleurodeles waltl TaxID=8319 RepID=A0AAV7QYC8_PLEWA|nr:hypothetical protein NDU88_011350 [Pleurodeles waltl]